MNSARPVFARTGPFSVRPKFLLGCAAVVLVLILPDVVAQSHILQRAVLLLAASFILAGWLLLLQDSEPSTTWRALVAVPSSVYLVVSLPAFFFEMSPWKWLTHHWISMYVRPWVHWGYALALLSIVCSFFGRGRARVAFVTGSVALFVLRAATGPWIF